MKDRQPVAKGPQQRIPFISAILHWLSMPVIVFLRSRFGFSFLSPKAVFLTFVWASVLFFIYAWRQPGAWSKYGTFSSFVLLASALYLLHLLIAAGHETARTGKHDHYSGTSHLGRFFQGRSEIDAERMERTVHLWIEPSLVLASATILAAFFDERVLSRWLLVVAPGFWLKEFLNYWYELRHEKKETDIKEDAEGKVIRQSGTPSVPMPSAGGRKKRVDRRNRPSESLSSDTAQELRFAEILRLMPPYRLEDAERNYRHLIKECHPDRGIAGSEERAGELNEAIEYFRRILPR